MSGSSSSELRAPIFNGENYDFWRIRMTTIFKSQDLWKMVQEGYEVPDSGDKSEDDEELTVIRKTLQRDNMMKDAKALGIIQGAVSDVIFPRISNEESSKAAWEVLQKEYRGDKKVTKVKLQSLRRDFEYTRMREDEPLKDYFTRLFDIVNQMKILGEELPRERLVQKLLISLTRPYDSIVNVIEETKDTDTLDTLEVMASLKAFEQRLERHVDAATERAFQSLRERKLTAAYTPQQNGVAERKNRTIIEMAKSMLHEKGIPYQFWGEAVNTAVYLLNRCPTSSYEKKTPFKAFTERKLV